MSEPVPDLESLKQRLAAGFAHLRDRIAAGGADEEVLPEALDVLVQSLGAVGGAVWAIGPEGLSLEYQLQLGETGLLAQREALERHGKCLIESLRGGQSVVITPGAQNGAGESINPTPCVLLAGLACGDRQSGPFLVLEALQRPATFERARAGQMRVLEQVCGMVSEFLRARLGKQAENRQALVSQVERFTREAHLSLDSKLVAYSIANEGRTLIGCDRVSVALRYGNKYRLTAVSGVPEIARRANSVRLAEGLIRTVMASGDALWFEGDDEGLPPQITKSLDAFVDETHARSLAVIPLRVPPKADAEDEGNAKPKRARPEKPVGAILVELYGQQRLPEGFRERTEVVAEHAAIALANAVSVESVFLMPVWRALGKVTGLFRGRTLPKTLAVLALVGGLLGAAVFVESDFELHAPGSMEPAARHDVFAETDGVVDEVLTEHGQRVAPGDKLAVLRNDELDLQLTSVVGKRQESEKSLEAINASLLSQKLPPEQRSRLASEFKSLEKSLEGLQLQEALLRKRSENLVIVSPAAGQVTTWDVTRLLMARPVQRGQVLLNVADLTGPWVLELRVPEHRMGHIADAWKAAQEAGQPLTVKFVLSTDPNEEHEGVVQKIASRAEIDDRQEHTVLVTVTFEKASIPEPLLRPGAAVTGKVHCGRRPLGYVWLHDVLEWFQREILFRL